MNKTICLIVKTGPLKGHKYFVKADCPVLIGRGQEANIRIDYDKFCSRSHAVVYWEKEACFVKDLNSTNGTHVNKVRILGNVKLENRTMLSFGATDLVVFIIDGLYDAKSLMDIV